MGKSFDPGGRDQQKETKGVLRHQRIGTKRGKKGRPYSELAKGERGKESSPIKG